MKEKIKAEAAKLGLDCCGIANQDGKSIIVCLFPYYIYEIKGNISKYAMISDYHLVCKKYLYDLMINLEIDDFDVYVDISPYDERKLAYKAGLGVIGKNRLLINNKYGSYVFIGLVVLNSIKLEADSPLNKACLNCGNCIKKCPGKALEENGFIKEKCLSDITQKKGKLSEIEKNLIIKTGMVWGCDECSQACPMNKKILETPIPEFKKNIISSLYLKDFEGLSNKEFKEKYKNRAFTWRGRNVLIRNCGVLEGCLPEDKL
mgnify:CR=1 FL=1